MTPGFASRRRAQDFDRLLSSDDAARRAAPAEPELARLSELVGAMRALDPVEPRPAFSADLRSRLMAEADVALAPAARTADGDRAAALTDRLSVSPTRTRRDRRVAWALGGFAVVTATSSMAVASQGALPGDALYPLKRSIEDARVSAQSDPEARADLLLDQARTRLDEVEALVADGDAEHVPDTLQSFTDQASEASNLLLDDFESNGDEGDITDLRSFTSDSLDRLAGLDDDLATDARPDLLEAALTTAQIDGAAYYACATCGVPLDLPDFINTAATDTEPVIGLPNGLSPDELERLGLPDTQRPAGEPGERRGGPDRDVDDPLPPFDPPDLPGGGDDDGGGNGGGNGGNGGNGGGGGNGGTGGNGGGIGGIVGGITDGLGDLLGGGSGGGNGGHGGGSGGLLGGGGLLGTGIGAD